MNEQILTLEPHDLRHAFTGLAKVVPNRHTLPVLQHIRLEADGQNHLTLSATDLDTHVTCRVPARCPDGFGPVLIEWTPFQRLIKAARSQIALVHPYQG